MNQISPNNLHKALNFESKLTGPIKKRIFVFKEKHQEGTRPMLWAIPENEIREIESQLGSHNVSLRVNGKEVMGSFEELIDKLGERVDIL